MVVGSLAQVFQNPTKLCRLGVKGYAQTRFSTEHKSFQAYAVNLYQVPVFCSKTPKCFPRCFRETDLELSHVFYVPFAKNRVTGGFISVFVFARNVVSLNARNSPKNQQKKLQIRHLTKKKTSLDFRSLNRKNGVDIGRAKNLALLT